MRIERLTCSGLLSYSAETPIEFPNHAVIVGPNNSGKSNIFRIIRIMLEALDGRQPAASQMSRAENTAFAEAEMVFSNDERGLLSEFFGYYNPDSRPPRVAKHPDYEQIGEFLASVTVRIGWTRDARGAGSAPRITVSFPQCGFKLSGDLGQADLVASGIGAPDGEFPSHPIDFSEFCARVFQNKDPVSGFAKFAASGKTAVHSPVSFSDKAIDGMPSAEERSEAVALKRRLGHGREDETLTLPSVLGSIVSRKIVHASAGGPPRRPFREIYEALMEDVEGDYEFTKRYNMRVSERLRALDMGREERLGLDGGNVAQFLFALKNSTRRRDREAFEKIQAGFADAFHGQLGADVALNYEWADLGNSYAKYSVPSFAQVLFTDSTGSATPDQIGAGALQVLCLLAAVHGIEDSVVMLDEPGINLHPAMLQTIMGTVEASEKSQFLIITHSPELLGHEVFDRGGDLIYVRKKGGSEALGLWGDGGAGEWWRKERERLKHQIDVRVFFANFVILAEGASDQSVLAGVAEYKADGEPKYNLARRNILIVRVDGKNNFPKYIRLLDAYKIPYVVLADRDNDSDETHEKLFGNKRTAGFPSDCGPFAGADVVLVEKNLEDVLKSMDENAFEEAEKAGGGSKVAAAIEFCKTMGKDAEKLCRVTAFLDHCIERARVENDA